MQKCSKWENGSGTAYLCIFLMIIAFAGLGIMLHISAIYTQKEKTQLIVDSAADAAGVMLANYEDSVDYNAVYQTAQDVLLLNGLTADNSLSSIGVRNEMNENGDMTGYSLISVSGGLTDGLLVQSANRTTMKFPASATVRARNNAVFQNERLQISFYDATATADAIIREAKKYLGVPYELGSYYEIDGHFDCGYYVRYVLQHSGAYTWSDLGRTVSAIMDHPRLHNLSYQAFNGLSFTGMLYSYSDLMDFLNPGDLLIFKHTYSVNGILMNPSHIGIYIGNGQMIHAGNPVQIVDLHFDNPGSYWSLHFRDAVKMPYNNLEPELAWEPTSPGSRNPGYTEYIIENFLSPEHNEIYERNGSETYDYKFLYDYLVCMGIDRAEYPPRTIDEWCSEVFSDPIEEIVWQRATSYRDLQNAANQGKIAILIAQEQGKTTAYIVRPTGNVLNDNELATAYVGYSPVADAENWNFKVLDFTGWHEFNTDCFGVIHE